MNAAALRAARAVAGAKKQRPEVDEMLAAARLSAKVAGCTCEPEIELRPQGGGVFIADIAHDVNCHHPSQPGARR